MSSLNNSLALVIAGVGVTIICPETSWLERLKDRYHPFLGKESSFLTLQVQRCSHPAPDFVHSDEISFQGQATTLHSQTYHGFINTQAGTAQICTRVDHPIEDIDYFLRVTYALLSFRAGGFLLHGAGIIHQGKGYLFFGHSGAGKTTVARLSIGDQILNDDLVILLPSSFMPEVGTEKQVENGFPGWAIHATPFWNPTQVKPSPVSVNLAGMFHLIQDKRVYLEPLRTGQALAELVASIPLIPMDVKHGDTILDRIESLQKQVPIYNLHFLPDASFWRVIERS
jgi:hypothetical protein